MECKDAIRMIHPYLEHALSVEETERFLKHTESCASCREELEIYFTVMAAMDNLDRDRNVSLNLKGRFEEQLSESRRELAFWAFIRRFRHAALIGAWVLLAAVLIIEIRFLF